MRGRPVYWTRERIIEGIRKLAGSGSRPSGTTKKENRKLVISARRMFGSWANACRAAGLKATSEHYNRQGLTNRRKSDPTPDEIRQECELIQQGWTVRDRRLAVVQRAAPVMLKRVRCVAVNSTRG